MNQLLAALAAVLVAAVPLVRSYLQAKFTPQKLAHAGYLARIAVQAAEKLGEDGNPTSQAKLDFASQVLSDGAKHMGLKLTNDEVLGFIHAALREMQAVAPSVLAA